MNALSKRHMAVLNMKVEQKLIIQGERFMANGGCRQKGEDWEAFLLDEAQIYR
jgi:hypothetical protein